MAIVISSEFNDFRKSARAADDDVSFLSTTLAGLAIRRYASAPSGRADSGDQTDMAMTVGDTREGRLSDVDRKRVLVVDDDLPIRGMLSAALRQHGFQVLLAGDGGEAERVMALHHPSIVLLDLMMPGINGWDFLQRLQETGFIGSVPIIVISAHLRVDPQAVLQMGVSAILPKPFNLDELMDLIQHLAP